MKQNSKLNFVKMVVLEKQVLTRSRAKKVDLF